MAHKRPSLSSFMFAHSFKAGSTGSSGTRRIFSKSFSHINNTTFTYCRRLQILRPDRRRPDRRRPDRRRPDDREFSLAYL